jgi:carboxylesterase
LFLASGCENCEQPRCVLAAEAVSRTAAYDLGEKTAPPVLFLHGLTGSTAELRFLGEQVAAAGYRAVAPLLPGHGYRPPDLTTAGGDDWLRTARAALDALGQPAHLVGLSMGALLALRLAGDAPAKVRSIALLAPAVRLAGLGRSVSAVLYRLPGLTRLVPTLPTSTMSDLRDPALAGSNPKNGRLSLHALLELRRLEDHALDDARKVAAPALVILGARDRTVSNTQAEKLIAPLNAELFTAERSGHQVGLDYDRAEVAEVLLRHFRAAEAAPMR